MYFISFDRLWHSYNLISLGLDESVQVVLHLRVHDWCKVFLEVPLRDWGLSLTHQGSESVFDSFELLDLCRLIVIFIKVLSPWHRKETWLLLSLYPLSDTLIEYGLSFLH